MDAIEYYSNEEMNFKEKCEAEKVNAFMDTLGIAFVTFEDDQIGHK